MKFISVTMSDNPNCLLSINADYILSMLEKEGGRTMIVFVDGTALLVEEDIPDLLEMMRYYRIERR